MGVHHDSNGANRAALVLVSGLAADGVVRLAGEGETVDEGVPQDLLQGEVDREEHGPACLARRLSDEVVDHRAVGPHEVLHGSPIPAQHFVVLPLDPRLPNDIRTTNRRVLEIGVVGPADVPQDVGQQVAVLVEANGLRQHGDAGEVLLTFPQERRLFRGELLHEGQPIASSTSLVDELLDQIDRHLSERGDPLCQLRIVLGQQATLEYGRQRGARAGQQLAIRITNVTTRRREFDEADEVVGRALLIDGDVGDLHLPHLEQQHGEQTEEDRAENGDTPRHRPRFTRGGRDRGHRRTRADAGRRSVMSLRIPGSNTAAITML